MRQKVNGNLVLPTKFPYYLCRQKLRRFIASNKKSKCEIIIDLWMRHWQSLEIKDDINNILINTIWSERNNGFCNVEEQRKQEEMEYKMTEGADALLDLFDEYNIDEVITSDRPNVCLS